MQQLRTRPSPSRLPSATSRARALPHGVSLRPLHAHVDDRGLVAEIFRGQWATGVAPVQWVMCSSAAGVLRGVHVHVRHDDYLVLIHGRVTVGLHDLRPASPTQALAAMLDLRAEQPAALVIPHGVAHGFLFLAPSAFVLGSSHYYDVTDELGCHWLDPELGLSWPRRAARLSARDAALPPMREVARRIPPWK